jgi:hypothetical protein
MKGVEASMTSMRRAACGVNHIRPTKKVPPSPISRIEARTAGQTSPPGAPQLPKCAHVPGGKVGGHVRKEGEPHLPPADFSSLALQRTPGSRGLCYVLGMRIAMVMVRGFT